MKRLFLISVVLCAFCWTSVAESAIIKIQIEKTPVIKIVKITGCIVVKRVAKVKRHIRSIVLRRVIARKLKRITE